MPFWEAYYRPHFDHIEYIDGKPGVKTILQGREYTEKVNELMPDLLKSYELVLMVSNDEIVVPDPEKYKDLTDYMDHYQHLIIRTTGYGVIEMDREQPIDLSRKITDQRAYWYRDADFDKPILTRIPVALTNGCHHCNFDIENDPDLVLFHLRDADLKTLKQYAPDRIPSHENMFDLDLEGRKAKAELIPEKWRVI